MAIITCCCYTGCRSRQNGNNNQLMKLPSSTSTWLEYEHEASSPTSTIAPKPDTPNSSPVSPSLFATWTPAPTMPSDEAVIVVEEFLESNSGCRLPCWWGFEPGETLWETAHDILTRLGEIYYLGEVNYPYDTVDVVVPAPKDFQHISLTHIYRVSDGVISLIEVDPGSSQRYSLPNLLDEYGPPGEVKIWTFSKPWGDYYPFETILFYPEKGIMARYSSKARIQEEIIIGCPQENTRPIIALWSPGENASYFEISNRTRNIDLSDWGEPVPLTDATGVPIEDFYKTFKDSNNESCLFTPIDIWRPCC